MNQEVKLSWPGQSESVLERYLEARLQFSSTTSRQAGLNPDLRLCSIGETFSNVADILMTVPANYSNYQ